MKAGKKIGRRRFITFLGWSTVVPFAWLAGKMENRNKELQPVQELILPQPASDGVFFHAEAILVSKEGLTYALSSRCTHLGCRIVEAKDGLLICPCHGSRYDMQGSVMKGPAAGNLKRLDLRTSATDGKLHITL